MGVETYRGRPVSVVGLGREGLAVTRVLAREGAQVTVSDTRDAETLHSSIAALGDLAAQVRFSLGANRPEDLLDCDLLVLSPGVDKRIPLVRAALQRGIRISSETELFLRRCPAPVIGITGSAGKTTTTSLVGTILREARLLDRRGTTRPVFVGGNIGTPLLERLDEITSEALVVLELSSFQLEWLPLSPKIAVVTNITPNHLDRHETMDEYIAAKANIIAHQGGDGIAILNQDEKNSASLAEQTPGRVLYFSLSHVVTEGAYLDGNTLMLARDGHHEPVCRGDELPLPGRHNIANVLAATCVAGQCGVAPETIRAAVRTFRSIPHRLEPVKTIDGVAYYDDSIATTPERTRAALAALDQPMVLILGGYDKHLPWAELAQDAVRRCRGVVLIGEAAPLIRRHLADALHAAMPETALLRQETVVDETTMAAAVTCAAMLAKPGDAVVLAPGCASYDMYHDYAERGDDFAREVRRLSSDG